MHKIQKVSYFCRIIFQILFVLLPVLLAIAWATSPLSQTWFGGLINWSYIPRPYMYEILHPLSVTEKWHGFAVSLLPLFVELYILYALIRLFKLYERGEIFSLQNVNYIRKIGYGVLVTQLIEPIYTGLMGVVLTMHNPHGHRFAAITLDQRNLASIFAGIIIILISWIMAEGCKLHEEQQLTI